MSRPSHLVGCLVLLALAAAAPATAAVSWERIEHRVTAEAADESMDFTFPFTVSDRAVTFRATDIPCGCALAEPDRPTYQAGERGVFSVRMQVEDRVGTQHVVVTARTDDAAMPEQALTLTAVIPELLRFNRKIAVWDKASGDTPQRITCTVSPGQAVATASIVSQHPAVSASVSKTADPSVFAIELNLLDPTYRNPVKLVLTTDLPVKRQATVTLWALNRLP
jgi:hypothetical protein